VNANISAPLSPSLGSVLCPDAPGRDGSPRAMRYWLWAAPDCKSPDHVVICVHGLTRQGRDFDALAQRLSRDCTVIAVDVAGRGASDWLADGALYGVPLYAADHIRLIQHVKDTFSPTTIDWIGTSMGGLIGIGVASLPDGVLAHPIRKLVLNDVGPTLEFEALKRIGTYVGQPARFSNLQDGADALWTVCTGFGPHTTEEWFELSRHMFVERSGHFEYHYDPAIALAFKGFDAPDAAEVIAQGNQVLWAAYDAIRAPTLVIRGEASDLLTEATLSDMAQRGPKAQTVTFKDVGHAPTLVAPAQQSVVVDFLLT